MLVQFYLLTRKTIIPAARLTKQLTINQSRLAHRPGAFLFQDLDGLQVLGFGEKPGLVGKLKGKTWRFLEYLWNGGHLFIRFGHLSLIFGPVVSVALPLYMAGLLSERQLIRWIRWSLARAGATFIKLGQWAATRPDVLSAVMCEELQELQADAPSHSMRWNEQAVLKAFGRPLKEVFTEFDVNPIGSGTIAQVHRAKLRKYLSKSVAVKITHPGIERIIKDDLLLLSILARLAHALIPPLRWISLPEEVACFGEMMREQLNLKFEAFNLRRFSQNFEATSKAWGHLPRIIFPRPLFPWVSRQCLVEDLIEDSIPIAEICKWFEKGLKETDDNSDNNNSSSSSSSSSISSSNNNNNNNNNIVNNSNNNNNNNNNNNRIINNSNNINNNKINDDRIRRDLAVLGLRGFLQMLLWDNFVHADLHPGNILVTFVLHRGQRRPPAGLFEELFDSLWGRVMNLAGSARRMGKRIVTAGVLPCDPDAPVQVNRRASETDLEFFQRQVENPRVSAQLVFLDTGLVTELSRRDFQNFTDLFQALVLQGDGYRAGELMIDRSPAWARANVRDREGFCRGLAGIVEPIFKARRVVSRGHAASLKELRLDVVLKGLFQLARDHHVRIDAAYTNLVMSLLCVEGLGRQLAPEMDLRPLLAQAALQYLVSEIKGNRIE